LESAEFGLTTFLIDPEISILGFKKFKKHVTTTCYTFWQSAMVMQDESNAIKR
jgi:hypothetical protein